MSASKYAKAISSTLGPVGFARAKDGVWRREENGFFEEVSLQGSRTGPKVTVNFALRHDRARRIVHAAAGPGTLGTDFSIQGRIGQFRGPFDLWWPSDDIEGPSDVSNLLRTGLLPFLEKMHAVDPYIEALKHQYAGGRWPYVTPVLELAVLLHEKGAVQEARGLLANPPERLDPRERPRVAAVRQLLLAGAAET